MNHKFFFFHVVIKYLFFNLFKQNIIKEKEQIFPIISIEKEKIKFEKVFESYNCNNNYFYVEQKVIIIQSLFRSYKAKKYCLELKRLKEIESISNSSHNTISSHNPIDLDDCIDNIDIQNENSKIKKKKKKYNDNNLDNTLLSILTQYTNNDLNLIPADEMKGYFLLKKKKFEHKGKTKIIEESLSPNISSNNNNLNNTNDKSNIKSSVIKEGFGIITWEDKTQIYSIFVNNKIDGISKYIDPINKITFEGEYFHNKPRGFGIYTSINGTKFQGNWKNNILNGIGIEINKDGTFYQGEFKNNKKHGLGLYRWNDGTIYRGEWENNEMTGFSVISYKDEKIYTGQVLKGLMNGYGEFSWKNGKKYFGFYKNNFKEGFGIYVYDLKPFLAYIGFWKEGKMDGIGIVIKGKKVKYGLWKKGERKQIFKGPWEFKKYYLQGSNMFKNKFCINDSSSSSQSNYVTPNTSIISDNLIDKEKDCYLKFMSKDVEYIKRYIDNIL